MIESTEALTAIDVNSASFTGGSGPEENALRTNLDAAPEIARQIRLRNIGGLIVIDFIHMESEENWDHVLDVLDDGLARDGMPNRIVGRTPAGLVEVTRRRRRESLIHVEIDQHTAEAYLGELMDALERMLSSLRPLVNGRLITIFGCGGDRDPGKRPLMAAAALAHSDLVWITSDNPRSEDPLDIIADITRDITTEAPSHVRIEPDRAAAIAQAIAAARPCCHHHGWQWPLGQGTGPAPRDRPPARRGRPARRG